MLNILKGTFNGAYHDYVEYSIFNFIIKLTLSNEERKVDLVRRRKKSWFCFASSWCDINITLISAYNALLSCG